MRTGDTALTVTASAGQLAITSLSPAGKPPDWIGEPVPMALPDHVFIDNAPRKLDWRFLGKAPHTATGETILRFVCREPELELLSIWQARPGAGPVEHHFELVNRSGRVIEAALQPSLALALTVANGHSLENWWVEKGAGRPSDAGTHREPIGTGYSFRGLSTPYAEVPEMIPWISIQDATAVRASILALNSAGVWGWT